MNIVESLHAYCDNMVCVFKWCNLCTGTVASDTVVIVVLSWIGWRALRLGFLSLQSSWASLRFYFWRLGFWHHQLRGKISTLEWDASWEEGLLHSLLVNSLICVDSQYLIKSFYMESLLVYISQLPSRHLSNCYQSFIM